VNDEPTALRILGLRGQIAELGGAIRQLQHSGLDSATAQLLISRKRAELECLMKSQHYNLSEAPDHVIAGGRLKSGLPGVQRTAFARYRHACNVDLT
jgi:hypothetical protein